MSVDARQPVRTDAGGDQTETVDRLVQLYPLPLVRLSIDGVIRSANPAAIDLLGPGARQAVVGQAFAALLEPRSGFRFERALARLGTSPGRNPGMTANVQLDGRPDDRCWLGVVMNGLGSWLPGVLLFLHPAGEPLGSDEGAEDNRTVLAAAVEAAQLGVWHHDLEKDVIHWGGHYREVLSPSPGAFDGTFSGLIALVHPGDRAGVLAAIDQARAAGSRYAHEFRVMWPDGQVRWVHAYGRFYLTTDGRPLRAVGAFRDVTAQRNLQRQLVQAQKIEAIGQLAAGIAHEINTPVQYVSDNIRFIGDGFASCSALLASYRSLFGHCAAVGSADETASIRSLEAEADYDYLATEIPRAMHEALEGLDRVATILRAVKSFSHPGTTRKEAVDLNEIVRNTLTVSRNEWKYVADVTTELAADLPPVPSLLSEIQQVVLNLVVNAAHAIAEVHRRNPSAKGRIQVRTRRQGAHVELTVKDSGAGIPEDIQGRIFDPFFTTKDVGKGTGQGLALVHDVVVKKHGGTVRFETAVGVGTEFFVTLPLHAAGSECCE